MPGILETQNNLIKKGYAADKADAAKAGAESEARKAEMREMEMMAKEQARIEAMYKDSEAKARASFMAGRQSMQQIDPNSAAAIAEQMAQEEVIARRPETNTLAPVIEGNQTLAPIQNPEISPEELEMMRIEEEQQMAERQAGSGMPLPNQDGAMQQLEFVKNLHKQ